LPIIGHWLAKRQVFGNRDKAVELRVELLNARQQAAGQLFG
jgi:hypothetical protein